MRWLFLFLVGLIAGACGLSFNPDLPSGSKDDGTTESNDNVSGDGDDGGIGIMNPPDAGSGGTGEATGGAGGAGGATPER